MLHLEESFFFLTSKIFLNDCLKRLKRLEVLLGTFGESTGTDRFLICHDISPLCIKEHSRGKRHRKYFRTRPNEAPRPGCFLLPRRRRGPDALRGRTDICEESSRPNENQPGFSIVLSSGRRLGYIGAKPARATTSQAELSQGAVPSGFVFRGALNRDF